MAAVLLSVRAVAVARRAKAPRHVKAGNGNGNVGMAEAVESREASAESEVARVSSPGEQQQPEMRQQPDSRPSGTVAQTA